MRLEGKSLIRAGVGRIHRPQSLTPQAKTILRHLKRTGSITQREAIMDHSVQSLTKRISELRWFGYPIESVWKKHPCTGQRYMRYTLVKPS